MMEIVHSTKVTHIFDSMANIQPPEMMVHSVSVMPLTHWINNDALQKQQAIRSKSSMNVIKSKKMHTQ